MINHQIGIDYTKLFDVMPGLTFSIAVIYFIVQAVVYSIGLVINIKVISVCWKKKETTTWQIHMINSIFLTIFWPLDLSFLAVSNTIPKLSMYTGEWFCKLSAFVIIYGVKIIIMNSLIVAVMKYVFIVHTLKARKYGNEKVQKLFTIINLTIPLILATFQVIMGDYEFYKAINNCLGLERENMPKLNIWQKLFFCKVKEPDEFLSEGYTTNLVLQSACAIQSALTYLIISNLPEAYFYYKIFTKMKR